MHHPQRDRFVGHPKGNSSQSTPCALDGYRAVVVLPNGDPSDGADLRVRPYDVIINVRCIANVQINNPIKMIQHDLINSLGHVWNIIWTFHACPIPTIISLNEDPFYHRMF